MAELRNCPFCGGEASIVIYQGSKRIFYIECKGCNALMGNPRGMISAMKGKLYFENEAELIEAWNTRKPVEAVVAELEKFKELPCGCCGLGCGECEYLESCLTGEEGYKVALDRAISIVRGKE